MFYKVNHNISVGHQNHKSYCRKFYILHIISELVSMEISRIKAYEIIKG